VETIEITVVLTRKHRNMRKNIKLFNPYAISSLKYANKISISKNLKNIN